MLLITPVGCFEMAKKNVDKVTRQLWKALSKSNLPAIVEAIDLGADLHAFVDDWAPPLWEYITEPEIVRVLLENGADPNHGTCNPPVLHAVTNRDVESLVMLLESGANPNLPRFSDGVTALMMATSQCEMARVKLLLEYGANPNQQNDAEEIPLDYVLRWLEESSKYDISEEIIAEQNEMADCLRCDLGDRVEVDRWGETPPEYRLEAFLSLAKNGRFGWVKLFIENGINVNAKEKNFGHTALIDASGGGDLKVVKLLIDSGADVNLKSSDKYTPLMSAASQGKLDVVKYLVENGAELEVGDQYGRRAIDLGIRNADVLKYLIKMGSVPSPGLVENYSNVIGWRESLIEAGLIEDVPVKQRKRKYTRKR